MFSIPLHMCLSHACCYVDRGVTCVTVLFFYYFAPLSTLRQVLVSRDSASFYWPLCVMNSINGTLWMVYGLVSGVHPTRWNCCFMSSLMYCTLPMDNDSVYPTCSSCMLHQVQRLRSITCCCAPGTLCHELWSYTLVCSSWNRASVAKRQGVRGVHAGVGPAGLVHWNPQWYRGPLLCPLRGALLYLPQQVRKHAYVRSAADVFLMAHWRRARPCAYICGGEPAANLRGHHSIVGGTVRI